MPFRPLAPRTARWRSAESEGMEHLHIQPAADGILVRSVVAGAFAGTAYGASYTIELDAAWHVRAFRIETTDGRALALASPTPGRWVCGTGATRADLDGCIDIDLSATPFTNTLPIRRLGLAEAQGERTLRMLYVPFDTFEPFPHVQFYESIETDRLYRFANDDRSFVAELPLDEDGLVLDYPGLFKRL